MGTGSLGGGSGALGRSGSGAAGRASRVADLIRQLAGLGAEGKQAKDLSVARRTIRDAFAQKDTNVYLEKFAGSVALRRAYEEVWQVSFLLRQERSWSKIEARYGVPDRPGCLLSVAREIARRAGAEEPRANYREIARQTVIRTLRRFVDGALFQRGRASDVTKSFRTDVADSLSGHFLGNVVGELACTELPALSDVNSSIVRKAAQERADEIVRRFESRFHHKRGEILSPDGSIQIKQQITHRDLFGILARNPEWFVDRLRDNVPDER